MTSEAIIEAEWLLDGYWTKPRFAFQTEHNAWSDIDVLAYKPETRHLVIAESKVQAGKNVIFAYNRHTQREYVDIVKYDGNHYLAFTDYLPRLCSDGPVFQDFRTMVKSITVQLVCNYVVSPEVAGDAASSLNALLAKKKLPCKAYFQLDSTLDVLARIIEKERNSDQNRRYGNQILDIAREINRYFHPQVRGAGKMKASKAATKSDATSRFLAALGARPTHEGDA
jgi:hypothetical protein